MKKPTEYDWRVQQRNSYRDACMHYVEGNEVACWLHLFLFAEAKYEIAKLEVLPNRFRSRAQSPRQQEVQRLWQQRGLLERTKANLSIVEKLIRGEGFPLEADKLREANRIINARIGLNMAAVGTVKERIPS